MKLNTGTNMLWDSEPAVFKKLQMLDWEYKIYRKTLTERKHMT